MKHKNYGFTLVELLIVVVVIAILASISVAAYNGMQQRAKNGAVISAATQVKKLVTMYIAQNGKYPLEDSHSSGTGMMCATQDSVCTNWTPAVRTGGNTALVNALAPFGKLPSSVPVTGAHYGVNYDYWPDVSRGSEPLLVLYWLAGNNQACGVDGANTWNDGAQTACELIIKK